MIVVVEEGIVIKTWVEPGFEPVIIIIIILIVVIAVIVIIKIIIVMIVIIIIISSSLGVLELGERACQA